MIDLLVLDTSVLGMVTNPKATTQNETAKRWLSECVAAGFTVVVPEIVDYELRRELLREKKQTGLARLDAFKASSHFLSIDNITMLRAAEFWARARILGSPAASMRHSTAT